ncbi:hypothetical protein K505DRAFT_106565 [Melanomma pulvis-pyrius CBS 109.77]|uniref:Uncharacterized protein n=1 Tax=Melanomma pulvis-pyrius CBS 109.77 TaxID=1314802 RepID=A0A6A6WWE9_9PLEO|nr:hypothetical protein K505DRAFT_106565 [Melanomma pulvis-pyrius CBS 109.77]
MSNCAEGVSKLGVWQRNDSKKWDWLFLKKKGALVYQSIYIYIHLPPPPPLGVLPFQLSPILPPIHMACKNYLHPRSGSPPLVACTISTVASNIDGICATFRIPKFLGKGKGCRRPRVNGRRLHRLACFHLIVWNASKACPSNLFGLLPNVLFVFDMLSRGRERASMSIGILGGYSTTQNPNVLRRAEESPGCRGCRCPGRAPSTSGCLPSSVLDRRTSYLQISNRILPRPLQPSTRASRSWSKGSPRTADASSLCPIRTWVQHIDSGCYHPVSDHHHIQAQAMAIHLLP